jgi:glycosyltransferase involved in cell wall biosynthesis
MQPAAAETSRAGATAGITGPATARLEGRLRVLQVVDTIDVGGAGKVALQGLRALVGAGVPVISANFEYPGEPSRFSALAGQSGSTTLTLRQSGRLDFAFVDDLVATARRAGVNLVETHSFKPNLVGWMLQRRLRVPWVVFAHGWTTETTRVRMYNAMEQHALLRCPEHVVAVADTIERRLRDTGRRGPITVLRNGIEPSARAVDAAERRAARASLGLADEAFVGVAIGRLSHEKAIDLLMEAVAGVAASVPRLQVLLAGDGRERAALEARRAALGLDAKVRFLGQLTDVRPVLAAADLLLVPSRTEGLPNVALEALDAGVPILSTRVGAMPELVADGETGWLVPVGDARAFGSRLAEVAARHDVRAIGLAGRERVLPRYTAAARLEALFRLYDGLLLSRVAA